MLRGNCQNDKTEILQIWGICPITGLHDWALC